MRHCRKDGGALGAVRQAIRSVFDVAARKDLARCSAERRAHLEMGIRRVRVGHSGARSLDQALPVKVGLFGHRGAIV